ncbi:hypothetical protein J25TS1_10770 [Bacillus paralicheniformis]|nr:hypothetical protein J23TS8_13240 [Bacillus paralicheniformis]GIN47823.1 hypothetical protein J25TS1_10770 [Bacillus paralicheniformis]
MHSDHEIEQSIRPPTAFYESFWTIILYEIIHTKYNTWKINMI